MPDGVVKLKKQETATRNPHQSCGSAPPQAALPRPHPHIPRAGRFLQTPNCFASQSRLQKGKGSVLHSLLRVSDLFAWGRGDFK